MRKLLLIVLSICFLLGMATRKEKENLEKTVEAETTSTESEKGAANDGNQGVIPLEKWQRDKKVDDKVYKIANELEKICKKAKGDYEAIGWNMSAARLVGELKDLGKDALPAIYDVAKDTSRNELLRILMTERLAFSYEPAVTKPLINFLMDKSESERMRVNVAELLGRILKDTITTPVLIETIEDKSNPEKVQWAAARACGPLRDKRCVEPLLNILKLDNTAEMRFAVATALASIGHLEAYTDELIGIFRSEKSSQARLGLIRALGTTRNEKSIKPLLENIQSEKGNNFTAIAAIQNIGGPKAKEALISLLNHEDEGIRFDASKALLKMDDRSVVPEVEKVLPTLEDYHRNMLSDSLRKIK